MKKEAAIGALLLLFLPIVQAAVSGDGICEQEEIITSGSTDDCAGASFYIMTFKETANRKQDGLCRSPDQCLVSKAGDFNKDNKQEEFYNAANNPQAMPHCIDSEQYILDDYCKDGEWTSRTAIVAATLLELPAGNFRLFCGEPEEVANRMDIQVREQPGSEYTEGCPIGSKNKLFPCTNNICVLDYNGKTAIGTSTNIPISSARGFLKALDLDTDFCNNVQEFGECSPEELPTTSVWADKIYDTIYYIPEKRELTLNRKMQETFGGEKNLLYETGKKMNQKLDILRKMRLFRNIYWAKKGITEIFAVMEKDVETLPENQGGSLDMLGIKYVNTRFNRRPCETYFKPKDSGAVCENQEQPNTQFIIARAESTTLPTKGIADLWRDATAKLR